MRVSSKFNANKGSLNFILYSNFNRSEKKNARYKQKICLKLKDNGVGLKFVKRFPFLLLVVEPGA